MKLSGVEDDRHVLFMADICRIFRRHPNTVQRQIKAHTFPVRPWRGGGRRRPYEWRRIDVERELQTDFPRGHLTNVIRCNTIDATMTPRKVSAFRLDDELLEGLQVVWERDGIAVSEQVRRAVRAWLEGKGVITKAERRRAATRKRS